MCVCHFFGGYNQRFAGLQIQTLVHKNNQQSYICTHVRLGLDVQLALGALELLHRLARLGVDDLKSESVRLHLCLFGYDFRVDWSLGWV